MASILYQIMIRIKDSFVPILKTKLGVGEPALVEETDTYLKAKARERTEKVTQSDSRFFHEVITKEDHLFRVVQDEVDKARRDAILAGNEQSVSLHRRRERYLVHGVEVSIDRIDELGTFLEVEGADRAAVESIATTLGFSTSQFIEHPYDWLKR